MYFRFFSSFLSCLIHDNDDDCWWCYNSWEMNKCDCALFPIIFQAFFSSYLHFFISGMVTYLAYSRKIVELKFPSQWVCMFCLFRAHSFQLTRKMKYFFAYKLIKMHKLFFILKCIGISCSYYAPDKINNNLYENIFVSSKPLNEFSHKLK